MKAILLSREADKFQARVAEVGENDLPEGDVTVKVEYLRREQRGRGLH